MEHLRRLDGGRRNESTVKAIATDISKLREILANSHSTPVEGNSCDKAPTVVTVFKNNYIQKLSIAFHSIQITIYKSSVVSQSGLAFVFTINYAASFFEVQLAIYCY